LLNNLGLKCQQLFPPVSLLPSARTITTSVTMYSIILCITNISNHILSKYMLPETTRAIFLTGYHQQVVVGQCCCMQFEHNIAKLGADSCYQVKYQPQKSLAKNLLHYPPSPHTCKVHQCAACRKLCILLVANDIVVDFRNMLASLPPSLKILLIFGATILPSMGSR
jgi:hypothetical protein